DGMNVLIGGGRQVWSTVRALSPRALRVSVSAMGVGHADPHVLHAHPNTLVTMVWLLYAPRSRATLTGSNLEQVLEQPTTDAQSGTVVVASCAPFSTSAPFAMLLGPAAAKSLKRRGAVGDFAYQFFTKTGAEVALDAPSESSLVTRRRLRELVSDPDSRV